MNLYVSPHRSPGGNEKTDALKRLFGGALTLRPAVTPLPARDPYPGDPRIKALRFTGLPAPAGGAAPFAYLGFPEHACAEAPVPGMVLVHGGGGHAYAEWVRGWVDRGFAAISFDGFGQVYTGPDHTYETDLSAWAYDPAAQPPMDGFASAGKPFAAQGYTYFVADILLANSLLRADPRVDPNRIGLTGISWGGVAAATAVGYDPRFLFAAPVYGGGFMDVSATTRSGYFRGPGITDVWDGKLLLGGVRAPVRFYNGDGDPFFDVYASTACAAAAPHGSLTLLPGFTHGQTEGSSIPELFRFAWELAFGGVRNVRIDRLAPAEGGAALTLTLPPDVPRAEACVYYRTAEKIEYGEDAYPAEPWRCLRVPADRGAATVPLPAEARLFYFAAEGASPEGTLHATTGAFTKDTWRAAQKDSTEGCMT